MLPELQEAHAIYEILYYPLLVPVLNYYKATLTLRNESRPPASVSLRCHRVMRHSRPLCDPPRSLGKRGTRSM